MCDSFVALPSATMSGKTILAKSADCQVNEAFALVRVPAAKHVAGEVVKVTHAVIPQVEETYEIILGKSFWTWGAELGINEYGVAIGNEAVFSTLQHEETQEGVITMDLVRIGLERGCTAREAVQAMAAVLEEFGQGGNCELSGNSHFDSSYLIADPREAWILETGGRKWAARQLQRPVDSISNMYVIRDDWDLSNLAQGEDWAATYGDPKMIPLVAAPTRQALSYRCMAAAQGQVSIETVFDTLREHGEGYHPATAEYQSNICVHAGPSEYRAWQATGAMVAELGEDGVIGWFTGTASNCLSVFKPVFLGIELPDIGPPPTEHFNPNALWWRHELLHRRAMADFENVMPAIREDFGTLEAEFLAEAPSVLKGTLQEKRAFMAYCFQKAAWYTEQWINRLTTDKTLSFESPEYGAMWQRYNNQAGLAGMPAAEPLL